MITFRTHDLFRRVTSREPNAQGRPLPMYTSRNRRACATDQTDISCRAREMSDGRRRTDAMITTSRRDDVFFTTTRSNYYYFIFLRARPQTCFSCNCARVCIRFIFIFFYSMDSIHQFMDPRFRYLFLSSRIVLSFIYLFLCLGWFFPFVKNNILQTCEPRGA